MNWEKSELEKIIKADDLHIAPFRFDGRTYGTPTWIWCVEVDGSLYVRAYNGVQSSWYQAATERKTGQIVVMGIACPVQFETVEASLNGRVDDAYRAKYAASRYLSSMISERAKATTLRLLPLNKGFRIPHE